ncbi:MAG: NUDIX hydrolase [Polyangiaceae bacterium]
MRLAPLALLPRGAITILREAARHLLRRPVVGVAVCARTDDGRWVLIRRADTGTWALPGGTLEWDETLRESMVRELAEEAGIDDVTFVRVVGAYSRPDRDQRFHGVTIAVECRVALPTKPPSNPLEIREVGVFADDALPSPLAMGMDDMVKAARNRTEVVFE